MTAREMFKDKGFELIFTDRKLGNGFAKYRFANWKNKEITFYKDKTFEKNGEDFCIDADLLKAIYKLYEEEGWL